MRWIILPYPYVSMFSLYACWTGDAELPLIARFMGPTWGPSGADRTQVGPMLAPWTLLSRSVTEMKWKSPFIKYSDEQIKSISRWHSTIKSGNVVAIICVWFSNLRIDFEDTLVKRLWAECHEIPFVVIFWKEHVSCFVEKLIAHNCLMFSPVCCFGI